MTQFYQRYFIPIIIGLISTTFSIRHLSGQTNPTQPNILLIIGDDMGIDMLEGFQEGGIKANTPTLNTLRDQGITFTNTWTNPKCTPTRAAMMSGKYGIKTGVTDTPGDLAITHTSIFSEINNRTNDAYAGAVFGKWHLTGRTNFTHPAQHGVAHYEGSFPASVDDYYDWEKVTNGSTSQVTEYVTSHITTGAIDWVNRQDQPWLLWVSHNAPHAPFHVPPSDLFSTSTGDDLGQYIAMIEAMDAEIGRLLANIPSAVLDNTLIIFIGDNGTPNRMLQNYPRRHGKNSLYQGGTHVPMIVAGAGVTRSNVSEDNMVNSVDIYATVLEAIGIDLPGGIYNSLSFNHLLDNSEGATRNYNYTELGNDWTIRNAQYKLIQFANGVQEFYDLLNDPLETNDLNSSLTVAQQEIKAELEAEGSTIRTSWSCNDFILNGEETAIDDCDDMTTSIATCAIPTLLPVSSNGSSVIQLSWEEIDNASYNIQIRFKGSTNWLLDIPIRSNIVNVRGPASTFEYRVRAICENGEESDFSAIQEFTISKNLVETISRNQTDNAIATLEIPVQETRLFPNPVASILYLEHPVQGDAEITIYNPSGKVVRQKNIGNLERRPTINVHSLGAGVYYLTIRVRGGQTFTQKFIKG